VLQDLPTGFLILLFETLLLILPQILARKIPKSK
jgi:hypothetical protein